MIIFVAKSVFIAVLNLNVKMIPSFSAQYDGNMKAKGFNLPVTYKTGP